MTKFISKENLQTYHDLLKPEIDKKLNTPEGGSEGQVLTKTEEGVEWKTLNIENFSVQNESASGDITINPYNKVTIVNCEGDITSVVLSRRDSAYNANVIFTSDVERTITIQRLLEANYIFTDGSDYIQLMVPANGYAEVNFLCDGNNHIFVRGI